MSLNNYIKAIYEQRDKDVFEMHLKGFSYSKIKAKYGTDPAQISRIVKKYKKLAEEKDKGIDNSQQVCYNKYVEH